MTDTIETTNTVTVRVMVFADSVELHAMTCHHRTPRDAEVMVDQRTITDLYETHHESVALNDGTSCVKPCLRHLLPSLPVCQSCTFGPGPRTGFVRLYRTLRPIPSIAPVVGTSLLLCDDCVRHGDDSYLTTD